MKQTSNVARGLLVLDADMRRRFDAFVRQYEPVLCATGLRLCGNASDAQDLVQDTFECALHHFDALDPERGRAWLGTVLRHRFIDRYRRHFKEGLPVEGRELEQHPALHVLPEDGDEPAWVQVTEEQHKGAVRLLPDELRLVYQMKALDGLSYEEIGQRLGIAPATVGTRLSRARRRLKGLLTCAAGRESRTK